MQRRNFTKLLCSLPFISVVDWYKPSKEIISVTVTSSFDIDNFFSGYQILPHHLEEVFHQIEIFYRDQTKRTFTGKDFEVYDCKKDTQELEFIGNDISICGCGCRVVLKDAKEIYESLY